MGCHRRSHRRLSCDAIVLASPPKFTGLRRSAQAFWPTSTLAARWLHSRCRKDVRWVISKRSVITSNVEKPAGIPSRLEHDPTTYPSVSETSKIVTEVAVTETTIANPTSVATRRAGIIAKTVRKLQPRFSLFITNQFLSMRGDTNTPLACPELTRIARSVDFSRIIEFARAPASHHHDDRRTVVTVGNNACDNDYGRSSERSMLKSIKN